MDPLLQINFLCFSRKVLLLPNANPPSKPSFRCNFSRAANTRWYPIILLKTLGKLCLMLKGSSCFGDLDQKGNPKNCCMSRGISVSSQCSVRMWLRLRFRLSVKVETLEVSKSLLHSPGKQTQDGPGSAQGPKKGQVHCSVVLALTTLWSASVCSSFSAFLNCLTVEKPI